ncbi:MAG: arginine--tRNA ligase [Lapillicoccus sp.]
MPSPSDVLAPRVTAAIAAAFGDEHPELRDADPVLRPSQFADLQANAPLALARLVGMPPREIAAKVTAHLDLDGIAESVEISGPGFINISLSNDWLADAVCEMAADARLGIPRQELEHIPIDYSSPNVAKEMHVGHLRTTVVGDALARTLERLGHDVIRQNHIGDWGTPFGMLIEHLLDVGEDSPQAALLETDPNAFYQSARRDFDTDPAFAERARARVVALQAGDPETLRLWSEVVELSKHYLDRVYGLLGVTLTDADLAPESRYNAQLAAICDELEAKGIAVVSDGALCVFLDGYTGREGKPVPLIVRKSDGGYGYGVTDLATIRYRANQLHGSRIIYVVGVTQALHVQMVWATARLAGWIGDGVRPIHVQIGNVLGKDRKLLRTRSGETPRLTGLLEEAVATARRVLDEARPDLSEEVRAAIAPQIGIGAVKYADLSVAHDSEYVFDLDRMVSLTGNTGPYLQYAAARVRSIFRTAGLEPATEGVGGERRRVVVRDDGERDLALVLLEFGSVVAHVGDALEPHRLAAYLFDLAQAFSTFYEHHPVLKAEDAELRESRLALCALTLAVLVERLGLLGVESPERM